MVLYVTTNTYFRSYLAHCFLEWKVFRTKVVKKLETHFVFNIFFPLENRAVYEIMLENMVQPGRPQMRIWRMRIAWWITKATNTHTGSLTI
jgi:hypothetical protein